MAVSASWAVLDHGERAHLRSLAPCARLDAERLRNTPRVLPSGKLDRDHVNRPGFAAVGDDRLKALTVGPDRGDAEWLLAPHDDPLGDGLARLQHAQEERCRAHRYVRLDLALHE